jgi:hypothetical protein
VLDAIEEPALAGKRARLLQAVDRTGITPQEVLCALGLEPDGTYRDDVTLLIAEREA